jgi:protein-tyrosine sulfotransferase
MLNRNDLESAPSVDDMASDRALSRALRVDLQKSALHFLVGVPRSGTSLLRIILDSHPRICAPSETPWMFGPYGNGTHLRGLIETLCTSPFGPVKSIAGVSEDDVYRAAQRFILDLFASKIQAARKDILLLKTPHDIVFVDEILRVFPESLILHIRRDVRDVALSTERTGLAQLNLFGVNTFENAVRRWAAWEKKLEASRQAAPDRILSIRYEDLVNRPAETLRILTAKLGVDFHPGMIDYRASVHDIPEWEIGSSDAVRLRHIESARAFTYRRCAPTPEQQRVIAAREADIVALGYPPGWEAT